MSLARELELDAVMDEALAVQPLAGPGGGEEVDDPLLDDSGPDASLDVLATPVLDDDRVDALQMEQMTEREAGGAGSDDPDLRPSSAQAPRSSSRTRWAMAKAPFAAGTPQ